MSDNVINTANAAEAIIRSYDEPSQSIKTTISNASIVIDVTAVTDSIRIGDGTGTTATITTVGSKEALDVNVADITLDATNDSVSIKNTAGTNSLAVNADGSINVSGVVSGAVTTSLDGLANMKTTQYTIGTSAVQLTPTPLAGRSSLSVKVVTTTNTDAIYIGNSSGVTTATGYPLFNGDSLQIDLTAANFLYAIGSTSGQLAYVMELG